MRAGFRSLLGVAVVAALGVAACSESSSGPPVNQDTINVADFQFNPANLTVTVGTTVTWNWVGAAGHNVTWTEASPPTPSPTQANGTYQRTFNAAGTYNFYCTIHGTPASGMRGSVTVN